MNQVFLIDIKLNHS